VQSPAGSTLSPEEKIHAKTQRRKGSEAAGTDCVTY
jgi:hypothetical protein